MNIIKHTFFVLVFALGFQFGNAQNIIVDEGYTPEDLVEDILINSSCANVFNVSVSGGNFASGEKSFGYFDGSGTTFPFQNGIILSTGKINNAPGPNSYLSDDGGGMGWNGDSDLNQALGLSDTYNATVLEFDFIPLGNKISFDYIFSSEQYLTSPSSNQCNFTDGFAFLLKRNGETNYQNSLRVALKVGFNQIDEENLVFDYNLLNEDEYQLDFQYKGLPDDEFNNCLNLLQKLAKQINVIGSKIEFGYGKSIEEYSGKSIYERAENIANLKHIFKDINHDFEN